MEYWQYLLAFGIGGILLYFLALRKNPPKTEKKIRNDDRIEVPVAKVNDMKNGEMKECSVGDGKVLLIKDKDRFQAIGHLCSHYSAPFKDIVYINGRVRCPWHGACFNTATGDIEDYPGVDSIPSYPTRIEGNDVIVTASKTLLAAKKVTRPLCMKESNDPLYLIVGGGPAAASAAEEMRASGFKGRIIMVSKESNLPLDRPKLSKVMNSQIDKILLRDQSFYTKYNIEVKLNTAVIELNPDTKTAKLSDGNIIKYQKCLLASGAAPNTLARFIKGNETPAANVFTLRTGEDAHKIIKSVAEKHVLCLGSSFIGMETASCIHRSANSITIIGMEKVPFERVLGLEVGQIMQKIHESKGKISFKMNRTVKEFKLQDGHVTEALLDNDEVVKCDVVIIGAGCSPVSDYIKSDSVKKDRFQAVIVDKYLQTTVPDLYAAGDIASFPLPLLNGELVRIEHWGVAQNQGKVAAQNMVSGNNKSYANIPVFWTAQFGLNIRYAGHANKFTEVILDFGPNKTANDIDLEKPFFIAYYVQDGHILAIASLNQDPIIAVFSECMHHNISVSTEQLKSEAAKGTSKQFIESIFQK